VFGDDRLSLLARGVYAQITTVPVGETFSAATLAAGALEDAASAQAGLDQLAAHGYLAGVAR
jgi:hypothetical protein